MMLGHSLPDPPKEILMAEFLRAYPGYTASTLLAEDAELIHGLWAVELARRKVGAALGK